MMMFAPSCVQLQRQLAREHPTLVGFLASARRGGKRYLADAPVRWAVDNDVYSGRFNPGRFTRWLQDVREYADRCAFVNAPDVVADSAGTIRRFRRWEPALHGMGFPVAFALQDGIAARQVPWQSIEAVFLGGSTDYKLSRDALRLLEEAGRRRKWRHVGRVNSIKRMYHFWDWAESFDGTGFAVRPDFYLRWFLSYMLARELQLELPGVKA